ncbi:hypothetical protein ACY1J9_001285 [Clostridium botulinum]
MINETKINIVDSIMGSGKTTYAIQKMKEDKENNYIYITPYLSEIQRIKKNVNNKRFYEPLNFGEGKLKSLHDLIIKNKNIASTHALFKMATEETKELLKANSYILILDEVMDVVEEVKLKKDDIKLLLDNDLIKIQKDNLVLWNEEKLHIQTQYDKLKNMCLNRNIFMINNTLLMWTFPIDIFNSFKEVYVLTYLFDGQIQRYYYDLYNINYEYYSINYDKENNKYKLVDYIKEYDLKNISENINLLLDDKINNIGDNDYSLSKAWFNKDKNKLLLLQLKNNISNYYKNKLKAKASENMWTTYKDYKSKLSGKGYTKSFVSLNCRATNDYVNKTNLVYCANIFLNPIIKQFFMDKDININEDIYALSELLQWIWRSCLRVNKPINLYIPSKRMRDLLIDWLQI